MIYEERNRKWKKRSKTEEEGKEKKLRSAHHDECEKCRTLLNNDNKTSGQKGKEKKLRRRQTDYYDFLDGEVFTRCEWTQ